MTLKDLVNEFKDDHTICYQLFNLYPDQKKSKEGYLNVIHELRELAAVPNDMVIDIDNVKDEDGDYWHVVGHDPKDDIDYAIEFEPWENWLGMEVYKTVFKSMSMLDAYCHCLWEMTWDGFNQKDIQDSIAEMNARVTEITKKEDL